MSTGEGSTDPLTEAVDDLLRATEAAAVEEETGAGLRAARERLAGPLRLALAGKVKAGKSTLLNALVGEELAPTDAGECTKVVTWYQWGAQARVLVHPRDGDAEARPYDRSGGALEVDLGPHRVADLDRITVDWPSRRLRGLTLIDTPGLASLSADVSARTTSALTGEGGGGEGVADAVLYLLRHAHASDARFLESFHDEELGRGTPMNAVAVLSRADEIGSCRLDAMQSAARVGARYARDDRLRRLCARVVPVAGLLGQAGTTLHEGEYRALTTIARLPRERANTLLLTADRFAADATAPLTEIERRHLLDRLGLFGVRLAVDLVRTHAARDSSQLATELLRRSGVSRLRALLEVQFTARSRVLKARTALSTVRHVLASGGCRDGSALLARVEEVAAGAHEFVEASTLDQVRAGALQVGAERELELERLLGATGHDPGSRLGLPRTTSTADLRAAGLDALRRWRLAAEHPLSVRSDQLAARVACRSVEGLLAALP